MSAARHSQCPAIRFTRGNHFGASTVRTFATACQFARPPVRIRPVSQPSGTFTSRLPAARSPSPPLDMTTAVAGPLCWRDSHPLERQLASLHNISGSQATHPVPLPRSKTPVEPTFLANNGSVDAAPASVTTKASALLISGLPRGFSTCCLRFKDGVATATCKTRFRLAGWPLPGGS
jgi:hypothetical protein